MRTMKGDLESIRASAQAFLRARHAAQDLRAKIAAADKAVDFAEGRLIGAMEAAGLESIKLETGEQFRIAISAQYWLPRKQRDDGTPNPDYERAMQWLRRTAPALIIQTVPWQSLGAYCREREAEGKNIAKEITRAERKTIHVRNGATNGNTA